MLSRTRAGQRRPRMRALVLVLAVWTRPWPLGLELSTHAQGGWDRVGARAALGTIGSPILGCRPPGPWGPQARGPQAEDGKVRAELGHSRPAGGRPP